MVRTSVAEAHNANPTSTQAAKACRRLRVILNVAVDGKKILSNPCRVKGAGQEKAAEHPVASAEQVLVIADAIDPQYRALVILGAWCSLRFGELAGLRRCRVNVLHRKIEIADQLVELGGGKPSSKPRSQTAPARLTSPKTLCPSSRTTWHSMSTPNPTPCSSRSPRVIRCTGRSSPRWAVACSAAKVTGLHFHDLRGSGATWAAVAGATLPELMHRVRQRTHTAAPRYQHATDEPIKEIADRLCILFTAATTAEPEAAVVPIRQH